jgi:hypothetical protein
MSPRHPLNGIDAHAHKRRQAVIREIKPGQPASPNNCMHEGCMNEDGHTKALRGIDACLARLEDAMQRIDARLVRLECTVQEMSNGITRLTWAVNLSGSVITVLLGIALVII